MLPSVKILAQGISGARTTDYVVLPFICKILAQGISGARTTAVVKRSVVLGQRFNGF